jgi:hypothetical protein
MLFPQRVGAVDTRACFVKMRGRFAARPRSQIEKRVAQSRGCRGGWAVWATGATEIGLRIIWPANR